MNNLIFRDIIVNQLPSCRKNVDRLLVFPILQHLKKSNMIQFSWNSIIIQTPNYPFEVRVPLPALRMWVLIQVI